MNDLHAQMMLPVGRWPTKPTAVGWYVVWSGLTTPRLVHWGAFSDAFRVGAQAVPVDTYAGPIPERKVRP